MTNFRRLPMLRPAFCALLIGSVLAGCETAPRSASDRAEILNGEMTVVGPQGFCVDPSARKDTAEGSFLLFGSCAAISGDPAAPKPAYHAMLSATIGPKAAGPLEATFPGFERFFHSKEGRAALARSGAAHDVDIMKVERLHGMMLLKIRDRSASTGAPVSPVYWRAITSFDGRISALSVLPAEDAKMSDTAQIRLLESFATATRAAGQKTPAAPKAGGA